MPDHASSTSDDRVISIRTRRRFEAGSRNATPPSADLRHTSDLDRAADLDHYERTAEPDDFRHRMVVNAIAFLFVTALVLSGLWLADTIATMRKTQDCILTGKRGCAPVEVTAPAR